MAGIWLDNKNNPPANNPFTNSGEILGNGTYIGGIGVLASYGPYTVVNSGTITAGTSTVGAIVLLAGGSVTNQTGGAINGGLTGVDVEGAGPVVNYAMISGNYAVVVRSSGYVSNATAGTISGATDGIFVGQQNYNPPIYGGGSTGKVVNKGMVTVTGAAGDVRANGVVLNVAGAYVNNSGTIVGSSSTLSETGIGVAENYGGTLVNSGMLRGGFAGFSAGKNPVNVGPATVTNTNTGTIIGAVYGVRLFAGGSVQNGGSIGSDTLFAIYLKYGGTVNNSGTVNGKLVGIKSQAAAAITNTKLIRPSGESGRGVIVRGGALTNQSGAMILGGIGGFLGLPSSTPVTIINGGTIGATNTTLTGLGIDLSGAADSITNQSTGIVYGLRAGVGLYGGGTLLNQGTIKILGQGDASVGSGVYLQAMASITNATGAKITGPVSGVAMSNASGGSFVNYGMITGTGTAGVGVDLTLISGGMTNAAGGYIYGTSYGMRDFGGALTLTNAGTIGGGTKAVKLASGSVNQLRVVPGAVFKGNVDGGNTISSSPFQSSILLLASPASTGVLSGLGSSIYNFATIAFAPGAQWQVVGSSGGFTGGETFSAFAPGDTLQINGVTNETVAGFDGTMLTLTGGATLDIIIPAAFSAAQFHVSNLGVGINGVVVSVSCLAPEARIRMATGEDIAIARLRPGMRVLTAEGRSAKIVWLGQRHVDCRRHPRPERVGPVRVRAGAVGPGLPARDLRLSPDHAVFVRDVLIPVRCLINGVTICQEMVDAITWYHLELPEHEIVLAENLRVESYLDTGQRGDFANGGGVTTLFPEFAARRWEMAGRAPLLLSGPVVEAVRAELEQRAAGRLGPGAPGRASARGQPHGLDPAGRSQYREQS